MDNLELEANILDILKNDNYFDVIMAAKAFEPEYKKSDFYKQTKKPLGEVLKEAKIFYALQFKDLQKSFQQFIDGLSFDHLNTLFDQIGNIYSQENNEIKEYLEVIKDLK